MLRVPYMLFALVLLLATHSASGQEVERPELQRIEKAFSTADLNGLSSLLSDRVQIAVFGRSRLYSRSQARFVLKDLFDQYPPQRFELSAPSQTSKGLFAAGTYRYSVEDEPFQVYIRLRKSGETWTLREILIDKTGR